MLMLGPTIRNKILTDARVLRKEILAMNRRTWKEVIPPEDPNWIANSEKWTVLVKTGWWRTEPAKLSDVAGIPAQELFRNTFGRRHPILPTGAFLFAELDGLPTNIFSPDEETQARLAQRPEGLLREFGFESRGTAPPDPNHDAIKRGLVCLKISEERRARMLLLESEGYKSDRRNLWRVGYEWNRWRIEHSHRWVGFKLNYFGCAALARLNTRGSISPMQPVITLVDALSQVTVDLHTADVQRDTRRGFDLPSAYLPSGGDAFRAWAVLASAAAAASAMKFSRLIQPPMGDIYQASRQDTRADPTLDSGPGDVSTVQIWRANTKERLAALSPRIATDERLSPIRAEVERRLDGASVEAQWYASLGVEVLEFMQQAWLAHIRVNCRRIW
jgi:hypothetical protein